MSKHYDDEVSATLASGAILKRKNSYIGDAELGANIEADIAAFDKAVIRDIDMSDARAKSIPRR